MKRLAPLALCLAAACLPATRADREPLPAEGRLIEAGTLWSGEVRVSGRVTVPRGATLRIAPGTRVLFSPGADGGEAGLTVLGGLAAEGTAAEPILLAAEGGGGPESWEGVRLDYVNGFTLRWAEIRDARYGLHAHFSSGTADNVRLFGNLEGARIGRSRIDFTGCRIEGNLSKGLSMTDSANRVTGCTVTGNRYGIFLFEGSRGDLFEGNNLVGNELFDLRLGDFFTGGISLRGNWWGPAGDAPRVDPPAAEGGPADSDPSPSPYPDAGYWPPTMEWRSTSAMSMEGFTDAAPAFHDGLAVGGSWGGWVAAFTVPGVTPVWMVSVGAPVDATPVVAGGLAIVPAWDRVVRALDLRDGSVRWTFTWPESGYDDHRQGSPVAFGEAVVVPAWNGSLYALDPATGRLLWEREVGGALRARPLVADRLLVAGGDGGTVAAFDTAGLPVWRRDLGAGMRGTPLAAAGRIVVTLRDGSVLGLDPGSGATAWCRRPGAGFEYASPIAFGDAVVVADTAGSLFLLSASDGAPLLAIPLSAGGPAEPGSAPIYATPAAVGGLIVAGDTAGILRAVDPATGLTLRRADLGAPIQATPVVHGDRLVVGTRAGGYCLLPLP